MSWSTVRADQFCTLITDGTHDSPKPQQSGRKLITSKHLKGHYIDFDSANWISEADYLKVISRSAVEQWDILFSMIGTIGNIYLEKNPHVEYACKNMGIFKFSGNKENALWMYYYLKSPQAKAYIQTHLRGSTQAYVPLGGLREMPVPVPPQSVRNEIIAVLRPIDEKIECNNAINDNLERQALALVAEYSARTFCSSAFSNIMNFDNGFAFQSRTYLSSGKYKIITIKNVQDGCVDSTGAVFIDCLPQRMKDNCILNIGDVLLSLTGNVGRVGVVCERNLLLNQRVAKIVPTNYKLLPFLYFVFRQSEIKTKLETIAKGTAQLNLSPTETLKLTIPYEESSAIQLSQLLEPLYRKIIYNNQESYSLTLLRDSLLPKLMSGEIDVSAVQL